jgi:DNA-binding XRE family transcriptional regulator
MPLVSTFPHLRILFSISRCIFRTIRFASRMDLREVFAANLRRLRHDKSLSQDDLAYEAEVSRSYLSQLEKGVFYASLKIIGKLAAVLEVEPAELLKGPPKRKRR